MIYTVLFRKWSDIEHKFNLVSDELDAAKFSVSEVGALTFWQRDDEDNLTPFFALPPTFWFLVEPHKGVN